MFNCIKWGDTESGLSVSADFIYAEDKKSAIPVELPTGRGAHLDNHTDLNENQSHNSPLHNEQPINPQ